MDPVSGGFTISQIITSLGAPTGIAALFIWMNLKQQQRTQNHLDKVENGQRMRLEEMNSDTIKTITGCSAALDKNSESLDRMSDTLRGVQCIREERRQQGA